MDALSQAELVALQRSAAMLGEGQQLAVPREVLCVLCEEVLANRALLQRLGTDLRSVARRASAP